MASDPLDITKFRGDSKPIPFKLWANKAAGTPLVLTGYSFKLTVDPEEEPVDATNNLFSLDGVITDTDNGELQFEPSEAQMDQTPGEYYYDFEITDPQGKKDTRFVKKFTIKQDITK